MEHSNHEYYMRMALKQAELALESQEVPVGAVVVHDNKVIAKAHNQMVTLKDPTAHAEMIAMTQASETLSHGQEKHRGSLEDCTLYVTLEPCSMCAGGMIVTKLKNLVYGAADKKAGACESVFNIVSDDRLNHRVNVIRDVLAAESVSLLQAFFKQIRKDRR